MPRTSLFGLLVALSALLLVVVGVTGAPAPAQPFRPHDETDSEDFVLPLSAQKDIGTVYWADGSAEQHYYIPLGPEKGLITSMTHPPKGAPAIFDSRSAELQKYGAPRVQDLVFANVLQVEHLSPKSPFPVGVGLYEVQEYLTTGKLVVHTPSRDGVDGTQRREFKPSHFWPAEAPPNEQAVKGTGQANEAPAPIPEETLGGSTAQSLDKQLALHDQPTAVRASTGSLPGDGKAQDGKLSTGEGAVSEAI